MRSTLRQATSTNQHRQLLDNPHVFGIAAEHVTHSLVAELNEEVIGFCTVLPISSASAELDAIFVDPSA